MKDMVDFTITGEYGDLISSFNSNISTDIDIHLLNKTKQVA